MKSKRMKWIALLTVVGSISAFAGSATKRETNPQKDKDVKEGHDRHQQEQKEKKEQQERRDKGQIEKPFEVDKSHQEHLKETEKAAGENAAKKRS